MAIIYALIAKNTDVVLVEHTDHKGNFQQMSKVLLRKIKGGAKYSIICEK
jgi:hypothetical protein